MKINLLYNSNNLLSGFINIDPLASPEEIKSGKKIVSFLDNLDGVVEDSECTAILAEDILCYIPAKDVGGAIDNWIRKLRHKGTLIISGYDIFEICRGISNRY